MRKNKKSVTQNISQNETKSDSSPIIPQRSKIKQELRIYERELTQKQKDFINIALDKNTKLMFVSGPSGVSKTYLAVYCALKLLNQKKVSDILYLRSAVESADSKLGFLPGEAADKMAPYIQPLIDKLTELLPKSDIDNLKKESRIDSIPIGHLRGLNWNAKVIILDEAQNCTVKELITMITRTGEFSKVFICGDPDQSDINGKSGFTKIMNSFSDEESKQNGIFKFEFDENDIVRSDLVKFIIKKLKPLINH